jgi:hypothetical protein
LGWLHIDADFFVGIRDWLCLHLEEGRP